MRFVLRAFLLLAPMSGSAAAVDWQITHLDNGHKIMILENHQVPQVSISTTVKVGAKNETDFFDGATHLLEHLILFRGTEEMSGDELAAAMRKHGAYFNGFTSSDWTDFVITLPKDNLEFALKIHADMLFRSNFPAAEMDMERQAVLEEINISEDNPFGKAYRASLKYLYGDHPYSKNVLGTKENVSGIPRDSIYAYYKRYYAPNNMTTVIVGDIDATATLELFKNYFAAIPRGSVAEDLYAPPAVRTTVDTLVIEKDVDQAYFLMMSVGPRSESPDQHALDLVTSLVGNGESSRLWKKLRTEDGLVYTVGFTFENAKYEGTLYVAATLDPANISAAESAIKAVLEEVKKNGFTEEDLRKAKNTVKTAFYTATERNMDLADRYAQYDSYIGHEFVDSYAAMIEKVTLAELNAAARKYLNTDSYVRTTVVPHE